MTATLPRGWSKEPDAVPLILEHLRMAYARQLVRTFARPGDLAQAVDPATVQTPALDLIDAALVRLADSDDPCDRLIISMPPQEGKSQRCTRFFPEWLFTLNKNLRIAIVSYGDDIAGDMSYLIRTDLQTFNGEDPENPIDLGLRLHKKTTAVGRWFLAAPARGGVYAVGIGGALTSKAVDVLIIDDPVKDYRSADSLVLSEAAWNWWMAVGRPRLAPGAIVLVVQTRWHENDLAGRLLAKQKLDAENGEPEYDKWTEINIPAEADHDPSTGAVDVLGRAPGEFMVSARGRTTADWIRTKVATAARIWTAMYQGRPAPVTGNVWQKPWWRRYETLLWTLDEKGNYRVECDEMVLSWDFTFKDNKGSDFVCGQVWARKGADVYLLDQVLKRLAFTDTITAFLALAEKWPQATAKYVEDKANGPAVIDSLKGKIPGIVPVTPKDSKFARAVAVSPFIQAGNVFLPALGVAMFDVDSFIEESATFPNATHDDQVDAASQALAQLLLDGQGAAAWTSWIRKRADEMAAESEAMFHVEPTIDPLADARLAAFRRGNR